MQIDYVRDTRKGKVEFMSIVDASAGSVNESTSKLFFVQSVPQRRP